MTDTSILGELIVGRVEPRIYAFTTNTVPNYLKVGDTYRPVDVRLDEWREHFPHLKREFDDTAKIGEVFFRDYSVHVYLETTAKRARLARGTFPGVYYSNEFFEGATRGDVKAAIGDIRQDFETKGQRYQFYSVAEGLPTGFRNKGTEVSVLQRGGRPSDRREIPINGHVEAAPQPRCRRKEVQGGGCGRSEKPAHVRRHALRQVVHVPVLRQDDERWQRGEHRSRLVCKGGRLRRMEEDS